MGLAASIGLKQLLSQAMQAHNDPLFKDLRPLQDGVLWYTDHLVSTGTAREHVNKLHMVSTVCLRIATVRRSCLRRVTGVVASVASVASFFLATWVLYISAGRLDATDGSVTRDSVAVRLLAGLYLIAGAWIGSRSWRMTLATLLPFVGTPLALICFWRVPARLKSQE